jgi:Ca2+-binding EF-hand superfamily protein
MSKKLQVDSMYENYDRDGDGIVSDEELSHMSEIKKLEHDLRKQRAQRRMATASLVAMGAFTFAMFLVDVERVKALSDISNLFYISGAGIVGAYMGASAFMTKNGK